MTNEQETDIHERLTRIETNEENMINSLHLIESRLFGNGQPGIIKNLQDEISVQRDFRSRVLGAISILSFVGVFSIAHILGWMGGKV